MCNPYGTSVKYLTINEDDISWGLVTTTVGYQSIQASEHYPTKNHPAPYLFYPSYGRVLQEFQLIYVTKGSGEFKSKHSALTKIKEGSLMILFPEEWHTYRPIEQEGWTTYWIGFKGYIAENLLNKNFISKKQPVQTLGYNEQIIELFQQAIDISLQEKTGFQQVLAGIAMHLLGQIQYTLKNDYFKDGEIVAKINKARVMIRENSIEVNQLESIAASINMSYSWFRKLFKQYTGISPAKYQSNIKLEKAKSLLINTAMPIKEIAFTLDFESTNYFSIFFKKKTGETPLDFRNKSRGDIK